MREINSYGPIAEELLVHSDAIGVPAEDLAQWIYGFIHYKNCAFCKVPSRWMNEQTGMWTSLIFFHSEYSDEEGIQISHGGADSVFNRIKRRGAREHADWNDFRWDGVMQTYEDIYLPHSKIEYGFHTGTHESEE